MCSEPVTLGGGMTIVHGVASGALGPEQALAFPMRVPALLDRARFEGLGKLGHAAAVSDAAVQHQPLVTLNLIQGHVSALGGIRNGC